MLFRKYLIILHFFIGASVKKSISCILLLLILVACSSKKPIVNYKYESDYTKVSDNQSSKIIIDGPLQWAQWLDNCNWSNRGNTPALVDKLICKNIGRMISSGEYFFIVFAGSWCEDSESQVPIIYEVFKNADVPNAQIQLFGINKDKIEHTGTSAKFAIKKAPTLVILHNGTEIGRIEEFPEKSWEHDIINILYKLN